MSFSLRLKLQNVCPTIVAVAVLHNIAIFHREPDILEELLQENNIPQNNVIDQARGIAFRRAFIEANFR